MRKFLGHRSSSSEPHGRSDASYPAELLVIDLPRKTALAQMRITIKIFRRLHDTRCDSVALQDKHHLVRSVPFGPRLHESVEFLFVAYPGCKVREPRVIGPFAVTYNLAEAHPLFLRFDRDHTPAIIALALVAAVRCSQAAKVSLGLRVTAIDEPFQICGAQHRGGGLCLC